MYRKVLSLAILCSMFGFANAQTNSMKGVQFSPYMGIMNDAGKVDFTFKNLSNEKVLLKAYVYKWNADGSLTETQDINIFPKFKEMEPSKSYLLRLVNKNGVDEIQKTYRLHVELISKTQLDEGKKTGDVLSFPLFVNPKEKNELPLELSKTTKEINGKLVEGTMIKNKSNIVYKANSYIKNGNSYSTNLYVFPYSDYFVNYVIDGLGENLIK